VLRYKFGSVSVRYTPPEMNLADVLTKAAGGLLPLADAAHGRKLQQLVQILIVYSLEPGFVDAHLFVLGFSIESVFSSRQACFF
jgi:hypothetical protein